MMNNIGKTLVLIHVTLSMLALTWAASILLQFVDWGWKQPRLEVSERVPSELDKRTAAVKEAARARDLALPPVKQAQDALFDAMDRYAQNHLFYRNELNRVTSAPDALVVKEVKYKDGVAVLDASRSGKPILEQNVDGIDKSYDKYVEDLQKLQQDVNKLVAENRELSEKAKVITMLVGGVDEAGKKVKVGLYELLEMEAQTQAKLRFEKEYIQPIWAESLERAQEFLERRDRLQQTLDRLQKDLGKK